MGEGIAHRTPTAHRVAADCAAFPRRDGAVGGIDVGNRIASEGGLNFLASRHRFAAGVGRIDIIAGPFAVRRIGQHGDHRWDLPLGDQPVEIGLHVQPVAHAAALAVQQIDHRVAQATGSVVVGQIDDVMHIRAEGDRAEVPFLYSAGRQGCAWRRRGHGCWSGGARRHGSLRRRRCWSNHGRQRRRSADGAGLPQAALVERAAA